MKIDDRVIVITGTRKGIGRFLAEYYLAQNMIVCGCSRSACDLDNSKYIHYELDVADEKAVEKMVNDIYKRFRKIDYLVNNAGIASMNHSLLTPLSVVEKIFQTNVYGTFVFCREVARIMAKRKYGRIINFTTVATPLYLDGESVYSASKSAIEQLTRVLAKELGGSGITCNAVGPSPVKTDLIKNIGDEKIKKLLDKQAIHRFADFNDIVNVINFYIDNRSSMITGQIIYLGGVF